MVSASAEASSRRRIHKSPASIFVGAEDLDGVLPGTWPIESTIEELSTLSKVFALADQHFAPGWWGGSDHPRPIRIPRDVAVITAKVGDDNGERYNKRVILDHEESCPDHETTKTWTGIFDGILPSEERSAATPGTGISDKGHPAVWLILKKSAAILWFRLAITALNIGKSNEGKGIVVDGIKYFHPELPEY